MANSDADGVLSRVAAIRTGAGGGDTSLQFVEESRALLQERLRVVAIILFAAFLAFLIRGLIFEPVETEILPRIFWSHVAVTVLLGIATIPLCRRCELPQWKLRTLEGIVFGLPAVFFVKMQIHAAIDCPPELLPSFVWSYPAESVISWLLLMYLYVLFVPVGSTCVINVLIGMAVAPVAVAVGTAWWQPLFREHLVGDGRLIAMVLWSTIGAITAAFTSMRSNQLRRQAFDAKRLGSYTLRERIGEGGMGTVYRAEHALLKRPAAIKLIRPEKAGDPRVLARFEEEVQAAAGLTHPNTIEIYDFGLARDGSFYYVMEYLPGSSLQELVEHHGPLPVPRAIHLLKQVAAALREAHARGLVHRDVKPGNVFVTTRGGEHDVAKLLDFGLVKTTQHDPESVKLTFDGAIVGSPLYAAPESATGGNFDARSDLYSLAATAYFMLSGRPVFQHENVLKIFLAHATTEPERLSDVADQLIPEQLDDLVHRCLAKEPGDRPESADAFLEMLERCDTGHHWTQRDATAWWTAHPSVETPAEHAPAFEPHTETVVVAATV